MDALVIGEPQGLAGAVVRGLRRQGRSVLQATAADAADRERATWLLDEAGGPGLIVVFDGAPYPIVHELAGLTPADIVLVVEQRAAVAGGRRARSVTPRDADGLTVVSLGRAGRRWFRLGAGRMETLSAERAAADVLRSCGAAAASYR